MATDPLKYMIPIGTNGNQATIGDQWYSRLPKVGPNARIDSAPCWRGALFSTCYYIKNDFYQIHIVDFFIIFLSSVCLTLGFDYAELKRYNDLPNQASAISDPEHVSVKFLGHSGPSWVSAAPSSGYLDPLTIPLSFFRESKAVLASTIIFFEDTSCYIIDDSNETKHAT